MKPGQYGPSKVAMMVKNYLVGSDWVSIQKRKFDTLDPGWSGGRTLQCWSLLPDAFLFTLVM